MESQNSKTVLGTMLAKLRKRHGLTQEQVAEMLKIKRSTYAYYERSITPTLENIEKLSRLFAVSTHYLMYGEEDPIALQNMQNDLFQAQMRLNDKSSVFSSSNDSAPEMNFAGLSLPERKLVCKFRLLPDHLKEKVSKEVEDLLDKLDD